MSLKLISEQLFRILGEWVFGFIPLPSPLEEKAIAHAFDYLDAQLIAHNPNAWADTEAYLLEQLEQLGSVLRRSGLVMQAVKRRFDPAVLAGKFGQ